MIGIIGAMDIEIKELLHIMIEVKCDEISSLIFHCGRINNCECVVVKCGPGKVNAAVCTQTLILKYSPTAIINIGVAGGIGENIKIGDIVISRSVVEHDMDTSALGDDVGFISGIDKTHIEADEKLCDITQKFAEEICDTEVHKGVIATGDVFMCDKDKILVLLDRFGAAACEMEGAAIGHTCYMSNIPFVVIRAISDNADSDAKVDFPKFAKLSAQKYGKLIYELLPAIK